MQQLSRGILNHSSRSWRSTTGRHVSRSSGTFAPRIVGSHQWYSTDRPFDKVLVANRGEIACRVIRTCRRMGVETVAIYSSADGPNSLHASMADEAYCIGTGPSAAESYLRGGDVIGIAQKTGAQAIHPGYGFLSENVDFCQKATDASLAFVGPGPKAIQAMGSKSHSKDIMEGAGVPTTPGYHGSNQDAEYLLHEAVTNVGFPLLIKAVMGGGGKGMRLVWKEKDFLAALESCQRESQSAFGDSSVLLEKYLVHPRHVEVQIVADTHGNVLHLNERDCSLQRRHQKIIEEAPASDLPMDVRMRFGEMGKRAAQAVGYVNAGTVEFLLDTQEENDDFYFCEMNTRLQVEHPITELITGVDLVEWQLRIAAGQELPVKEQSDIGCQGHAMEARIYAENPARDFMPATGNVWHHQPPAAPNTDVDSNGVRVDTGIQPGQDIDVYYDPMISKLIVYGKDREAATDKLIASLKQYQIAGVPTNIDFLIQCAQHPTFRRAGAVNTGFLENHGDEVHIHKEEEQSFLARALGAFATLLHLENRVGVEDLESARKASSPWSQLQGSCRSGGGPGRMKRTLKVVDPDTEDATGLECWSNRDGSFDISMPSEEHDVMEVFSISGYIDAGHHMHVLVNGTKRMSLTTVLREEEGDIRVHVWNDDTFSEEYSWEVAFENPLTPTLPHHEHGGAAGSQGTVKAPMPGKITRINVSIGDAVSEGQVLVVMEAMKMEHAISAPRNGVVTELGFAVGDVVQDGSLLAVVAESEASTGDEA